MRPSRSSDATNPQVFRIVLHTVLTSGSIVILNLALLPGVVLSVGANLLGLWSLMAGKQENDQLTAQIKELSDEICSLQADRDVILQEAEQRLEETKVEYICVQESTKAQYKELIAELKARHGTRLAELDAQMAGLRSDYSCRLQAKDLKFEAIKASHQKVLEEYQQERTALKSGHGQTLQETKDQYEREVQSLKAKYKKQLASVQTEITSLTNQVHTAHEQLSGIKTVPLAKGKAGAEAIAVIDSLLAERQKGPLSDAQVARHRAAIATEIILKHGQQPAKNHLKVA